MITTTDFLAHHGVKGMKWGVRKKAPRKMSSDFKKTAKLRSRHPSELSNKQLKTINERTNLEQNYKRMNPTKIAAGIAAVSGLLATAEIANKTIKYLGSPAGKAAVAAGKLALKNAKSGPVQTKAASSLVETLARNSGQIALKTVKK